MTASQELVAKRQFLTSNLKRVEAELDKFGAQQRALQEVRRGTHI
jgi:hypothetical protein